MNYAPGSNHQIKEGLNWHLPSQFLLNRPEDCQLDYASYPSTTEFDLTVMSMIRVITVDIPVQCQYTRPCLSWFDGSKVRILNQALIKLEGTAFQSDKSRSKCIAIRYDADCANCMSARQCMLRRLRKAGEASDMAFEKIIPIQCAVKFTDDLPVAIVNATQIVLFDIGLPTW